MATYAMSEKRFGRTKIPLSGLVIGGVFGRIIRMPYTGGGVLAIDVFINQFYQHFGCRHPMKVPIYIAISFKKCFHINKKPGIAAGCSLHFNSYINPAKGNNIFYAAIGGRMVIIFVLPKAYSKQFHVPPFFIPFHKLSSTFVLSTIYSFLFCSFQFS